MGTTGSAAVMRTTGRGRLARAVMAALTATAVVALASCSSSDSSTPSPTPTTASASASASAVEIPNIVGQGLKQATQALIDAGLTTGTISTVTSDQPIGTVLDQSPAAGTTAAMGTPVVLTVATASSLTVVPDLAGQPAADAANALLDAGLAIGTVKRKASDKAPGTVLSQQPAAGTSVVDRTPVNLTISDGQITVPNVTGMAQADATSVLAAVGLTVGNVSSKNSGKPAGSVISQSPAAGKTAAPGSKVNLTTSNGKTTVPNITGKPAAQAANALLAAGLQIGTVSQKVSDKPTGTILSQAPSAGALVATGTAVNVVVSDNGPTVAVPDITGMTQAGATNVLLAVGLTLGTVSDKASDKPPSTVLAQSPAAGSQVGSGSRVDITVSNGLIPVPNVVGQTEAKAVAALTDAGLAAAVQYASGGDASAGTVIQQDPPAGSQLPRGKTVVITVVA